MTRFRSEDDKPLTDKQYWAVWAVLGVIAVAMNINNLGNLLFWPVVILGLLVIAKMFPNISKHRDEWVTPQTIELPHSSQAVASARLFL